MPKTASVDYSYNGDYWPLTFIAIVPRVTSTLSILSYFVILFLIFRSFAKASTIYHRIMVEISIAGILLAISTGLGTWPMPETEPEWVVKDFVGGSWPGPRYGNNRTCDAQGFLNQFGHHCIAACVIMLCVYYACAIGFRLKERNIRKYVQPVLLCLPLALGLGEAIFPLVHDDVIFAPSGNHNMAYGAGPWCKRQPIRIDDVGPRLSKNETLYGKIIYLIEWSLVVGSLSVVLIWTLFARRNMEKDLNEGRRVRYNEVDETSELHDDDEKVDWNGSIPSAFQSRGSISVDLSGAISSKGVTGGNARSHEVVDLGKEDITGESKYMYYSKPSAIFMEGLFYGKTSALNVASDGTDNSCNLASDTNENLGEVDANPNINPAEKSESMNSNSISGRSEFPGSIDLEGIYDDTITSHRKLSLRAAERKVNFGIIAIILQSLAYIILFGASSFVTWFTHINKTEEWKMSEGFFETMYKVDVVLETLHGVFNMLIFLMHKIYNIRRIDNEKSILEIFLFLFRASDVQEPCFVSRISLVKEEALKRDLCDEILVSDEKGDRRMQIRHSRAFSPNEEVDNIEAAGNEMYVEGETSIRERDHDLSFAPSSKYLESFSDDEHFSLERESMPGL